MDFKKKVFVRTVGLLFALIFFVCSSLAFVSYRNYFNDSINTQKRLVNLIANNCEQLILLDDRIGLLSLLRDVVKNTHHVEYAFIEKDKSPFISTFSQGTPQALLNLHQPLNETPDVQYFTTHDGETYLDIARIVLSGSAILHLGLKEGSLQAAALHETTIIIIFGCVVLLVAIFLSFKVSVLLTKEVTAMTLELQEKHQLNQVFLDSLPNPARLINKDRTIIAANKSALEYGTVVGDLCWHNCIGHSTANDSADKGSDKLNVLGQRCEICSSEKMFQTQVIRNLPEVEYAGRFWDVNWVPISVDKYLHYCIDITERKLLESKLVNARKLESIGQLAAGIAHEINTPAQYVGDNILFLKDAFTDLQELLVITNKPTATGLSHSQLIDLLEESSKTAEDIDLDFLIEEIPLAIKQAQEGISKVSHIVKAMKEFSHPGGKEKTMADLNQAIKNTITVSKSEWKLTADLTTDLDDEVREVPCFIDEFNQVLLNMIINATHAIGDRFAGGESKGEIIIQTRKKGQMAEVYVTDNGSGIPDDIQGKIFDPFYTTKAVGKGSGQGLSIAHDLIVNKHGGTIDVKSELGKGSTFIIQLPLAME